MLYLDRFILPTEEQELAVINERMAYNGGAFGYIDNAYPCGLFPAKQLREISFAELTVFYGGNGSGKSTLLNLIANRLGLKRVAPYNTGEAFDGFCARCRYTIGVDDAGERLSVPDRSRIIGSDDVFDYMLCLRDNNADISERKEAARAERGRLRYGETIRLESLADYEQLRLQVMARSRSVSRRAYIRRNAGEERILGSNGETALAFFEETLKTDALYCLDEPENSLSPKYQQELARLLSECVRYCGCQLILATHSPFLLALPGARIYDLDACPVDIKPWRELESIRVYEAFFRSQMQ